MARTTIASQQFPLAGPSPGVYGASYYPNLPLGAGSANLTMSAADTVNSNYTAIVEGKTVLLAYNAHATTTFTLTINSVSNVNQRTGDITNYALAALTAAMFGPFNAAGWNQSAPAG